MANILIYGVLKNSDQEHLPGLTVQAIEDGTSEVLGTNTSYLNGEFSIEVDSDPAVVFKIKVTDGADFSYTTTSTYRQSDLNDPATKTVFNVGAIAVQAPQSSYVYVGYADNDGGSNFSLTPLTSSTHLQILTSSVELANPQLSDFTGSWVQFEGPQGPQGIQGEQGPAGADTDIGYEQNTLFNDFTGASGKWYRFARATPNDPDLIDNGDGTFSVQEITDGTERAMLEAHNMFVLSEEAWGHHSLVFNAGAQHSRDATINITGASTYLDGNHYFRKLRILTGDSDYHQMYLEVFVVSHRADFYTRMQATKIADGGNDWTLLDFTETLQVPANMTATELVISPEDGININKKINTDAGYKVGGQEIIDSSGAWVGSATGPQGSDGRGISNIELQGSTTLLITYSDETTQEIELASLIMGLPTEYIVEGIVADANGLPVSGNTVKVYHKKLDSIVQLGAPATTSTSGEYEVNFNQDDLDAEGVEKPDLVVKVFLSEADTEPLVTSPLVLGAGALTRINLTTGSSFTGLVEYDFLKARLETEVNSDNLSDYLSPSETANLAQKTKSELDATRQFLNVKKTALDNSLDEKFLFGLAKSGKFGSLVDMMTSGRSSLEQSLQQMRDESTIDNRTSDTDISAFVDDLKGAAVGKIIAGDGDNSELMQFFQDAGIDEVSDSDGSKRSEFLSAYLNNESDMESFWTDLGENLSALTSAEFDSLKALSDLIGFTGDRAFASYLKGQSHTVQSLKDKSLQWFKDELDSASMVWDDRFEGDTATEKRDNYAQLLLDKVEDEMPSLVYTDRLAKDASVSTNALSFLTTYASAETVNPSGSKEIAGFDFGNIPVGKYVTDNNALDSISDDTQRAATLTELEEYQRMYRMVPNHGKYDTMKPLMDDGITSASAVNRMGQAAFLEKYGQSDSLGTDTATEVFLRAQHISDTSIHLISNFSSQFAGVSPRVVPKPVFTSEDESDNPGLPNLEGLFGTQYHCSCEHCRSLYSPAAYLVDLLNWLSEVPVSSGPANLQLALDQRRPEIKNILLTCENTNAALPYVDLVIEVLENAIAAADAGLPSANSNRQTTQNTSALKAHPEYLVSEVYAALRKSVYPWSAPFDLFESEAHVYTKYLGIDYPEMRALLASDTEDHVAAKKLQLNLLQKSIITDNLSDAELHSGISGLASDPFPSYFDGMTGGVGIYQMQLLMEKSGLTFNEISDYLESYFINPDEEGRVAISWSEDIMECDPEDAFLDTDSDLLMRLMRFHKLRTHLGWTIQELDCAIETIQNSSAMNDDKLVYIAAIADMARKYKLPVQEVATWWGDLSTDPYFEAPSFFTDQFVNPAVNRTEEAYYIESIPGTKTLSEIFDPSTMPSYGIYEPAILPLVLAGSQLNEADLSLILANDEVLTVANLSYAFRVSSFCQAVKISVQEYLDYAVLLGIEPVNTASSATTSSNTAAFIELLEATQKLKLDTAALHYIITDASTTAELDQSDWQTALEELQAELAESKAALEIVGGNAREETIQYFNLFEGFNFPSGELWTRETLDELITIMDGVSTKTPAEQEAFIDAQFPDPTSPIYPHLINDSQMANLKAAMITNGGSVSNATLEARYEAVFLDPVNTPGATNILEAKIEELLWPVVRELAIVGSFATFFGANEDLTRDLITARLFAHSGSAITANYFIYTFANQSFLTDDLSATKYTVNGRMLHKMLLLAAAMKLSVSTTLKETEYLFSPEEPTGLPDLTALYTDQSASVSAFNELWKIGTQHAASSDAGSLFTLLYTANQNEAADASGLEDLKGWIYVNESISTLSISGSAFYTPAWYWKLKTLSAAVSKSYVKPAMINTWMTVGNAQDPDAAADEYAVNVQAMSNACKSKNGTDQWLSVAPDMRDDLRIQQRDALSDYLLYDSSYSVSFTDRYHLYEHFLIDTEMDPCRLTTRIKQANSTVQLFVQRMLMNLEDPFTLRKKHVKEWEWRKNYRVWEANRKVFLYPENWIEPELRDDQTDLFKEFTDELFQRDVTMENAQTAFLGYLEKLDDLADMEVAQLYMDTETDILHVFARTKSHPHRYYYRQWVNDGWWTPWQKIEQDVDSDHLVPVVYNGRLFLYWASIISNVREEKKHRTVTVTIGGETEQQPMQSYQVNLNWSEYKDGNWTKRRRSKDAVFLDREQSTDFDASNIFLSTLMEGDYLVVTVDLFMGVVDQKLRGSNTFSLKIKNYGGFKFMGCNKEPHAYDGTIYNNPLIDVSDFGSWYEKTDLVRDSLSVKALKGSNIEVAIYEKLPPKTLNQSKVLSFQLLKKLLGGTRITIPQQVPRRSRHVFGNLPFFMEDDKRTLFVRPVPEVITSANNATTVLNKGISDSMANGTTTSDLGSTDFTILSGNGSLTNGSFFTVGDSSLALVGGQEIGQNDDSTAEEVTKIEFTNNTKYEFNPFDHRYICTMVKQLNLRSLEDFFKPEPGRSTDDDDLDRQLGKTEYFDATYDPTANVVDTYPVDDFDFRTKGAYSVYNWEIFFHAPFMIAQELTKNQRFEEAQKWFHFIFDPTMVEDSNTDTETGIKRFWRTKPFHTYTGESSITAMLRMLADGDEGMETQVAVWRATPFNPHAIARLRHLAYMKNVVMRYIDMLIAWGDQLFTRDSIESVNEATQVYLLALQILGRRPEEIARADADPVSYDDIEGDLDAFSNALMSIENVVPTAFVNSMVKRKNTKLRKFSEEVSFPSTIDMFYFCIPKNDLLLGYWDTVADRLFKIRNCQNIDGVVRQLPLFQPPIDPAMLVRAAAAGISIGAALNDASATMPFYRFQYLLQKAIELTNDVKSLGASLLSALEKRDAEDLSQIRQSQEVNVLEATLEMKQKAVEEADKSIETLQESRTITEERRSFYMSRNRQYDKEKKQLNKMKTANTIQNGLPLYQLIASAVEIVPRLSSGVAGAGPLTDLEIVDGEKLGNIVNYTAEALGITAGILSTQAGVLGIVASQDVRYDDWQFQAKQAGLELGQIDRQIQGAEIRKAMAEKDLSTFEMQIANAKGVEVFMKDKFTNKELYGWMVKELSKVYFQSYQMAYDMAKKAEKAYHYEIGIDDPNSYINFGLWDSLKKGLLTGEKLHQDLKRLDIAHIDKNKRERELTKQVSLAMLNGDALERLRTTGKCDFDLPELLFDLDHPGHYMRRIKSVSISIPCVTGPYTGVKAKLSLLSSRVRKTTGGDYNYTGINDGRFIHYVSGVQSISTSRGQNDSGVFELNFNDSRYLPFEGTGAIGSWRLELPFQYDPAAPDREMLRQFDYETISDAILTINYTARDGGSSFKIAAEENLTLHLNEWVSEAAGSEDGFYRAFSLRHDFPTEFHQFMNPVAEDHSTALNITNLHFPQILSETEKVTTSVQMIIKVKQDRLPMINFDESAFTFSAANGTAGIMASTEASDPSFGGLPVQTFSFPVEEQVIDTWTLFASAGDLQSDFVGTGQVTDANGNLLLEAIEDIILIMNYKKI